MSNKKEESEPIKLVGINEIPNKERGLRVKLFNEFLSLYFAKNQGKALQINLSEVGLTRQGLAYILKQWNKKKHWGPFLKNNRFFLHWRPLAFTVKNQKTCPVAYVYVIEKEEEVPKE